MKKETPNHKPNFCEENWLKPTYSNVEFKNVPGQDPRTRGSCPRKGGELRQGREVRDMRD